MAKGKHKKRRESTLPPKPHENDRQANNKFFVDPGVTGIIDEIEGIDFPTIGSLMNPPPLINQTDYQQQLMNQLKISSPISKLYHGRSANQLYNGNSANGIGTFDATEEAIDKMNRKKRRSVVARKVEEEMDHAFTSGDTKVFVIPYQLGQHILSHFDAAEAGTPPPVEKELRLKDLERLFDDINSAWRNGAYRTWFDRSDLISNIPPHSRDTAWQVLYALHLVGYQFK